MPAPQDNLSPLFFPQAHSEANTMTRIKKTRSLKGKANIRTGKKDDFRQWRHEQAEQGNKPKTAFQKKKSKQRKEQAAKKLERLGLSKKED